MPIAEWAAKNGIKKVTTVVSDYAPGHDGEKSFSEAFTKAGGTVESIRAPLAQSGFRPFPAESRRRQARRDLRLRARRSARSFMKQYRERGLDKSGIKLIGPGDVTDDEVLNEMGDVALGVVTAHFYSTAHRRPGEQSLCRGVQEGEQRPAELHVRRRL